MRLFLSINIDDNIKSEITKAKKVLEENILLSGINAKGKLKWEDESKYHITLFFIGEMSEMKLPELIKGLEQVRPFHEPSPMNFRITGFNAFPNFRYPRVLILDTADESGRIKILSDRINEFMKTYGYNSDKPFRPHITLARVRRDIKLNLTHLNIKDINIPEITFKTDKFTLMESRLGSSGAVHLPVRDFFI
ncbi:MAG: RNA 2',3'-cyclic phosphodiesterase [Ignavibacteria bacterium]|nr:RNA 2',3'-cyclic phosphodiesterase [Ignavibacteria bacterium]